MARTIIVSIGICEHTRPASNHHSITHNTGAQIAHKENRQISNLLRRFGSAQWIIIGQVIGIHKF